MPIRIAVFVLIMAAFSIEIYAASFDCAKAKSRAEILICSDSELSSIDDELAKIYSKAKSLAPSPTDFKAQGEHEGRNGKLPASINSVYLPGTPNDAISC